MSVYLARSNFQTDEHEEQIGPFAFVQVTYNNLIRAGAEPYGSDEQEIARFEDGVWRFADGTVWTDITVTAVTA